MNNDTCERCGQSLAEREGFCDECLRWLQHKGKLSDEEVIETVQLGLTPVASTDAIVLIMGATAVPLLLSLFAIAYPLIDVFDDHSNRHLPNAPMGPVFTAFLAVLLTLLTVMMLSVLARRKPWAATLVAAGVGAVMAVPLVVVASMELPPHAIVFVRMHSVPFTLDGILTFLVVLQGISVLILAGAVYLAALRQSQIASARNRLSAWANQDRADQCPPRSDHTSAV